VADDYQKTCTINDRDGQGFGTLVRDPSKPD